MSTTLTTLLLCLGASVNYVLAYPNGAPSSACTDMFPSGHGVTAQSQTSGYFIQLSSQTYCSSGSIDVTLTGVQNFEGFFCQSRSSQSSYSPEGTLTSLVTTSDPCGLQSSLTHTENSEKSSVSFRWQPFSSARSTVYIVCTVVQNRTIFWQRLQSAPITYNCQIGIGDSCTTNSNCLVENSKCDTASTFTCVCDPAFKAVSKSQCSLRVLGDDCETTANCAGIVGSICSNGQCDCPITSRRLSNACQPIGLGSPCFSDTNCALVNWAKCNTNSGTCFCPEPYIQSGTACVTRSLNDPCKVNDDCTGIPSAYCNTNVEQCVCLDRYIDKSGVCQQRQLGESCSSNAQCGSITSGICSSFICTCPQGFRSTNQFTCTRTELGDDCNESIQCASYLGAICNFASSPSVCACGTGYKQVGSECQVIGLNEACINNFECQWVSSAFCNIPSGEVNGVCSCPTTYKVEEGTCIMRDVGDVCVNTPQCGGISGAICDTSTSRCACPSGYTLNFNVCQIASLGTICQSNPDCSAVENAVCDTVSTIQRCVCSTIYIQDGASCRLRVFRDSCQTNSQCSALTNAVCSSGTCDCITGFILNSNNVCQAIGLGTFCQIDSDCGGLPNIVCDKLNSRCVCDTLYKEVNGNCVTRVFGDSCTFDAQCNGLSLARCKQTPGLTSGTCDCRIGYTLISSSFCQEIGLNGLCSTNDDCSLINQGTCSFETPRRCACQSPYVEINGVCRLTGLGTICQIDSECGGLPNIVCDRLNSRCVCDTLYKEVNGNCVTRVFGDSCTFDAQCNGLSLARCKQTPGLTSGTCDCRIGYTLISSSFCQPIGLNGLCSTNDDCSLINQGTCSFETPRRCACQSPYVEINGVCRLTGLGTICQIDSECGGLPNIVCDRLNSRCVCDTLYKEVNGNCVTRVFGDSCTFDAQCNGLSLARCKQTPGLTSGTCDCRIGYTLISSSFCQAIGLNGLCSTNDDCSLINQGTCSFETPRRCACQSPYVEINGVCRLTGLGTICQIDSECGGLPNIVCDRLNSRCVCDTLYKEVNGNCVTRVFGDSCTFDAQCNGLSLARCKQTPGLTSGTCDCRIGYTLISSSFCQAIVLNGLCSTNDDCSLINQGTCSFETPRRCACQSPYVEINGVCRLTGLGTQCSIDADCSTVSNSYCNPNISPRTCACRSPYVEDAGRCIIRGLGSNCSSNTDCQSISFSFCGGLNQCTCSPAYKQVNQICVKREFGESCTVHEQCGGLTGAICDSICICPFTYKQNDNADGCLQKGIGDTCDNTNECANVFQSECNAGFCRCIAGFTLNGTQCSGQVNGGFSQWSSWGSCSVTCGAGGFQTRSRTCTNPPPQNNGADCSGLRLDTQSCNTQPCAVNGGFSQWSSWGSCSVTCAGGFQTRSRTCTNPPPQNNGTDCSGLRSDTQSCNTQPCAVNGGFSQWSSWGSCSVTCAGGFQTRSRACTNPPPQNNGADCSGLRSDTQSCNTQPCAVNGGFSQWSSWGSCSVTCAGGFQTRSRTCTNPPPQNNGADCSGLRSDTQSCNTQPCAVNGGFSQWSSWGSCSVTCAGGFQTRSRTCTNPPPQNNGADCSGLRSDTQSCNTQPCAVNGGFSQWSSWGSCSVTCAGGFQTRSRTCTNPPPQNNGADCSGLRSDTQSCNTQPCAGLGVQCSNDFDCRVIGNARCDRGVTNTCVCQMTYRQEGAQCVPIGYGESCRNNTDCGRISFSECNLSANQRICVCQTSHKYINNACQPKGFGDVCSKNDDCGALTEAVCSQPLPGRCTCPSNYVQRGTACIRFGLGKICSIDDDCSDVTWAVCDSRNTSTCVCQTTYRAFNGNCVVRRLGDRCDTNNQCRAVASSICDGNMCKCRSSFIQPVGSNECRLIGLGDRCQLDNDCNRVSWAICDINSSTCSCRELYEPRGGQCYFKDLRLGDKCRNIDDCRNIGNAICDSLQNTCTCSRGFKQQQDTCFETGLDDICRSNDDCNPLSNTYCDSFGSKTCICSSGYLRQNGRCVLQEIVCSTNDDCRAILTATCDRKTSTCQCQSGYKIINSQCISKVIGDSCIVDFDCRLATRSVCDIGQSNRCICPPWTKQISNNQCAPKVIGDSCKYNADCQGVTMSECDVDGTKQCVCMTSYKVQRNVTHVDCVVRSIGDRCSSTAQCGGITAAICDLGGTENKCVCPANYKVKAMTCLPKVLNSRCSSNAECFGIRNTVCDFVNTDSCKCLAGYRANVNIDECTAIEGYIAGALPMSKTSLTLMSVCFVLAVLRYLE